MEGTGKRLTTIEAIERQRQSIEKKLQQAKAELDHLDMKIWIAGVELSRLVQSGW